MEKRTVHSFNGLAIFVFFLYFAKVSSDPIKTNIIDFMKSDKDLCNVPVFLYNDTIISTCTNVSYPVGTLNPDYTDRVPYLCLIFYDTWNKICQSRQLLDWFQANFTDTTTFKNYLLQLAPKTNDGDGRMFCKSIEGITFSHKKLKSNLLHLIKLNNYTVCHPFCFNMNNQFVPLCEMLAWSKRVDNDLKEITTESQTGSGNIRLKNNQSANEDKIFKEKNTLIESHVTTSNLHEDSKTTGEFKEDTLDNKRLKPLNSGKKLAEASETKQNPMGDQKQDDDQPLSQLKTETEPVDSQDAHKTPLNLKIQPQDVNKVLQGVDKDSPGVKQDSQHGNKELQSIDKESQNGHKEPQNGYKESENGNKNSEHGNKESDNGNKEVENGNKESEVGNKESEVGNKESEVGNKESEVGNKESEVGNKESEVGNKESENVDKESQAVNGDLPITNKDLQSTNKEFNEHNVNTEINQDLQNRQEDGKYNDDQNDQGGPDIPIDTDQPPNRDDELSFHTMRTDEESHFFTYFTVLSLISIVAYIGYYNKQKILAIVLEGRRSRNSRGRRRPSTANYRKLDCTLEEAVTSQCNANVTHVIY